MNDYYVYYDGDCCGSYSNHGVYHDVVEAQFVAKYLVARMGGQAKVERSNLGHRVWLGHVGAMDRGRGVFFGYRDVFDARRHDWWGKRGWSRETTVEAACEQVPYQESESSCI